MRKLDSKVSYLEYLSQYNNIISHNSNQKTKIAILRSFTCEQIKEILTVDLYNEGYGTDIYFGGYNQYIPETLDCNSEFYKFDADFTFLCIRLEELYPKIFNDYENIQSDLKAAEDFILNSINSLIQKIKSIKNTTILLNNFISPMYPCNSLYDFQNKNSQINFIKKINLEMIDIVNRFSGVYIVDCEYISNSFGKKNIIDRKMWYLSKNPYKIDFYMELSKEYVKYIKAVKGNRKKCIVLDLDNTLWGGILGEDGFNGIKLGDDYPGRCYKDFQIELKKLKDRGILLAIDSKNNNDEAINVIDDHPDMVLRKDDFANVKINWDDKATNLIRISEELNIGIESLIFIDDNPAECELINQAFDYKVKTINVPQNPINYADILNRLNDFETLSITNEDKNKTDMYRSEMKRKELRDVSLDLETYYKSLEMMATIGEANDFYIPRIAQLTQKTNQFNMTAKRYTEEDIKRFINSKEYKIFYMNVKDKFGDNGIVGVCIVKEEKNIWSIDTFLMSCRVMKRNLEIAFMSYICSISRKYRIGMLTGEYIPTEKNKSVKDFYSNVGFRHSSGKYIFNLNSDCIECPKYIKIISDR